MPRLSCTRLAVVGQGRGSVSPLWDLAGSIPAVDFDFASGSMRDLVSGQNLIAFTRPSLAWGWDGSQFVQFANDTPRIVVDPATGLRGLLVEEARTNLLLNSTNAADASWVKSGTAVVTNNNASGLFPGISGDTVSVTSGGVNRITASCVVATSTTYTLYSIVRAGSVNGMTLRAFFSGGTIVDTYADFTFSTGLFANAVGAGVFSARRLNAEHWLIACTIASGNNTAAELRLSGLVTAAQTGTTFVHIHSQIELGAFPTSPIITTGSALTRSADVAAVSGANFPAILQNASLTLCAQSIRSFNTAGDAWHATLSDGTFSNRIQFRGNGPTGTSGGAAVVGGSVTGSIAAANLVLGVNRQASAWAVNDAADSLNGAAVRTVSPASLPSLSQLNIGAYVISTGHINNIIPRLTIWPTRLPNATLQALTSA